MAKEVGTKVKRGNIAAYIESNLLGDKFDVVEDNMMDEEPSMKLETKSRVITLSCDAEGNVQENFKMRPGADEEEYLKRQKAYIALNLYYQMYHSECTVVKNSFESSEIKLDEPTRTITLIYDFDAEQVYEKDRAKKVVKNSEIEGQISLLDLNIGTEMISGAKKNEANPAEKKEVQVENHKLEKKVDVDAKSVEVKEKVVASTKSKKPQKNVEDVTKLERPSGDNPKKDEEKVEINIPEDKHAKKYDKLREGSTVRSIYSNKQYTVVADLGNVLKIKDSDRSTFEIARADVTWE